MTPPDLTDLVVPTTLLPPDKLPEGFNSGMPLTPAQVEACFDSQVENSTPGLGPANGGIGAAAAAASASDKSTNNNNKNGHEFGVVLRKLQSGVSLNYRWWWRKAE